MFIEGDIHCTNDCQPDKVRICSRYLTAIGIWTWTLYSVRLWWFSLNYWINAYVSFCKHFVSSPDGHAAHVVLKHTFQFIRWDVLILHQQDDLLVGQQLGSLLYRQIGKRCKNKIILNYWLSILRISGETITKNWLHQCFQRLSSKSSKHPSCTKKYPISEHNL